MKSKFKILIFTLFLLESVFVLGQVSNIFEIKLQYDNGDLSLKTLNVKISEQRNDSSGEYSAEIKDFDNLILDTIKFNIPNVITYDDFDPDTGEIIGGFAQILNQTEFILELTYYSNAQQIVIYDSNDDKKLTIDVSHFAKNIGTKKEITPEIKELEEVKEEKLKEEIQEIKLKEEKKDYSLFIITGGILVILFLIFIFLRKKK